MKNHAGSLKHLEINGNCYSTDVSVASLCDLIKAAQCLEHLNIECSGLREDKHMSQLKKALVETESKASLKFFDWSYDAMEKDDFV